MKDAAEHGAVAAVFAVARALDSDSISPADSNAEAKVLSQLPKAHRDALESRIAVRGSLEMVAGFPRMASGASPESLHGYTLVSEAVGETPRKAYVFGARDGVPVMHPVPLWGYQLYDGSVVVADSPVRVVASGKRFVAEYNGQQHVLETVDEVVALETRARKSESEAAAAAAFVNSKPMQELTVAVLIVKFSDEASAPTDVGSFTRLMNKVEAYWTSNSNACSSMSLTFSPILDLAGTRASYGGAACPISSSGATTSPLDDDAWNAWSGHSPSDYDRYIIVFSEFSTCPWAGLGLVAGGASWINGVTDPDAHWHVTAHELGHNYGLKHANLWVTADRASPGGDGESVAYFDDFDIMGAISIEADRSSFHVNPHKKFGLGWIPSSDVATATTSSCSTTPCTYRIKAHDHQGASGTRALRILQSGNRWYWMGVRQAIDYAPAARFFANGLVFHYIDDFGDSQVERESNLLDMTAPYTSSSAWTNLTDDAPLQVGYSYRDAGAGITITPVARYNDNAGNAVMDVAVYTGPVNNAPVVSSLALGGGCSTPTVGEALVFEASASDPDGDVLVYGWNFGDGNYGSSTGPRITHAYGTSHAFTVTVTVSDTRGSSATRTLAVTVDSGAGSCGCTDASSCSGHGVCAGSVCACSGNYTGATCGTELSVASLSPEHKVGAPAGTNVTVTTTAGVFAVGGEPWCWFRPQRPTRGYRLSETTVNCPVPTPATLSSDPYTVVVEVSPNGGSDWSDSRKPFTYGDCKDAMCSGHGTCVQAVGRCACGTDWTTDPTTSNECDKPLALTSFSPAAGPTTGGLRVSLAGSSFDVSPSCADVVVRVKDTGSSGWEAVVPAQRLSGTTAAVVLPAAPSAMTVSVEISPNRGRDWAAAAGSFTYIAAATLHEGETLTGRVASSGATDRLYFESFFGDASVGLSVTLTSPTGGNVKLAVGLGVGAHDSACAESMVECPAGNSLSFAAGSSFVGVYSIEVSTTDAGGADYSLTMGVAGGAGTVIGVTPNATAAQPGYSASSSEWRQYRVPHVTGPFATRVAAVASDSARPVRMAYVAGGSAPVDASTSGARVADSFVVQACQDSASYLMGVAADGSTGNTGGAGFKLSALRISPPTAPVESVAVSSTFRSITIGWSAASDPRTPSDELEYWVYYQGSLTAGTFNTTCRARAGTLAAGPLKGLERYTVRIGSLKPAFAYDLAIVVRNSDGVETTYGQQTKRTVPSACILLSCVALRFWKKRKRRKTLAKQQEARAKAGAAAVSTRKAKAKAAFKPRGKGELKVAQGEVVILMGQPTKQGWIMARSAKGKQGLVPFSYFKLAQGKGKGKGRSGRRKSSSGRRGSNRV
ncbi:uncharacterized protein AMSG_09293 [Thecamonas trahens ATCC 50062]|uniref:PKD domain-containing protein n=1 Tax=Thecamonas trahens ATCC 50062 TaxID=461836 RepID=A0A0L0DLM1_THETB|nr:hypothetical protein AMSG_09293 [Thecamonas trahens ATCC 50062]KNC53207.1 hypothetical protein AMSG_09293 [Thecamonas trahens ATCC 50062]|eukprot:XP_013754676.1 hypothetical protein AMSG_09293 [Thecamonas trahens ATCC 50062]